MNTLSRRKFLGLVGAGVAAGAFVDPVWAAFELAPEELARWRASLLSPGMPRVYFSNRHTDARMHLGGIGTGNVEIGADGQFLNWQLFNNLRDGRVPFYFAVRAGTTAKLLQTAGGPDWPRVNAIEMTGEYPVATLRFKDDDLPVLLELEAFSPFAPLDSDRSSWPLNIFRFRIHNPTASAQAVSLAAMMLNPVGYAAIGEIQDCSHPDFGANRNEVFHAGQATGLFFRAEGGPEPVLDKPVTVYLPKDLFVIPPDPQVDEKNYASTSLVDIAIPPLDRPTGLRVEVMGGRFSASRLASPACSVIWLEDAPVSLPESLWVEIKSAVTAGATLVFSGGTMPLLRDYAANANDKSPAAAANRADILFEDFEHGYAQWTVVGTAFGTAPVHGTLPDQQPVSGFIGRGLVNSYVNGDDDTGKLISRDFVIERNFIRFLVGGGHYPTTQVRLLVGGRVVRATSGRDNERLEPAIWNVTEFAGQTAHIEIVDEQKGGWGHINADQIVFSDQSMSRSLIQALGELLPIDFEAVEPADARATGETVPVKFRNPTMRPGTVKSTTEDGLEQFTRPFGQGQVVLLAGRLLNPARTHSSRERQRVYAWLCSLTGASYTRTKGQSTKEPGFGTLTLAAIAGKVTGLTGFEDWSEAWQAFQANGCFSPLTAGLAGSPTATGKSTHGALASTVTIPAGETVVVPFLLAWHYPNKYGPAGEWIGCHYATQWQDARAVMQKAVVRYQTLARGTESFRETFYDSTLPYWLLDCLTANSAIIRHIGVVFRLAAGDIYGWEGSNGSCRPTCTHVWGYEQSLAHLFPDLEREMRALDYHHQQNADGGINNRTDIPSPPHPTGEPPFTDGHASCILKAYREALNSSDESFFKDYWLPVKRAVEYLIARDAARQPDGRPAGILQDDQRNTYDEALHGVTTFIGAYYLAALRAGEEWARRMGDAATADRYHAIFESGQKKLIELCWNGEYFQQNLADYNQGSGEVGPGCMSDQLLGQWWAHQLGLGYLLPQKMVMSAMAAVFKYNWKSDLTGWKHSPRAFAGARDKGLIVCTWPRGGRPARVLNYSDEVWTGIEYQVAAHLIYEGMVEEGLSIARGARDRYDGLPRSPIIRNPWCEIECGGHYTRAMSSWSLLLALSGFEYDGPRGRLRFAPRCQPDDFRSFFSTAEGWGTLAQKTDGPTRRVTMAVKTGRLRLNTLQLDPLPGQPSPSVTVHLGMHPVPVTLAVNDGQCEIQFAGHGVEINPERSLEIILV